MGDILRASIYRLIFNTLMQFFDLTVQTICQYVYMTVHVLILGKSMESARY